MNPSCRDALPMRIAIRATAASRRVPMPSGRLTTTAPRAYSNFGFLLISIAPAIDVAHRVADLADDRGRVKQQGLDGGVEAVANLLHLLAASAFRR